MKISVLMVFMTMVAFCSPVNNSIYLSTSQSTAVDNVTVLNLKKRTEVDQSTSIADCAICYESIDKQEGIELHSDGHAHSFHKNCLKSWFASERINGKHPSCPECRRLATLSEQQEVDPSMNMNFDLMLADAATSGDLDFVRLAAERASYHGLRRALNIAAMSGHRNVVEYLIPTFVSDRKSIDIAFFHSVGNGRLSIIEFLVPKYYHSKKSLLEWVMLVSAGNGRCDIVKFLVPEYVSRIVPLKMALSIARRQGHDSVVEFLKDKASVLKLIKSWFIK